MHDREVPSETYPGERPNLIVYAQLKEGCDF